MCTLLLICRLVSLFSKMSCCSTSKALLRSQNIARVFEVVKNCLHRYMTSAVELVGVLLSDQDGTCIDACRVVASFQEIAKFDCA